MRILILLLLIPSISFSQCDEIELNNDKFLKTSSVKTPVLIPVKWKGSSGKNIRVYSKQVYTPISFIYLYTDSNYYAFVTTSSEDYKPGAKGVSILFENGEVYNDLSAKIDIDYSLRDSRYTATVRLDEELMMLFKTSNVTDIRVGFAECSPSEPLGMKIKEYFNCLLTKTPQ